MTLDKITEFLQESEHYIKIRDESLVGIFVSLYVKKCHRPFIKDIATSKVKLGMGNLGNKGCCAIRF